MLYWRRRILTGQSLNQSAEEMIRPVVELMICEESDSLLQPVPSRTNLPARFHHLVVGRATRLYSLNCISVADIAGPRGEARTMQARRFSCRVLVCFGIA